MIFVKTVIIAFASLGEIGNRARLRPNAIRFIITSRVIVKLDLLVLTNQKAYLRSYVE